MTKQEKLDRWAAPFQSPLKKLIESPEEEKKRIYDEVMRRATIRQLATMKIRNG